jgi:hypothetical protein
MLHTQLHAVATDRVLSKAAADVLTSEFADAKAALEHDLQGCRHHDVTTLTAIHDRRWWLVLRFGNRPRAVQPHELIRQDPARTER